MGLKKIVFENKMLYNLAQIVKNARSKLMSQCSIQNDGNARFTKDIQGKNHKIIINKNCTIYDATIRIRGNNNTIIFGENCHIGPDCSFWLEGNDVKITIGDNTSFTRLCQLNAQEDGSEISIGSDCMFSNQIIVRTSDSHPIYDIVTGKRINNPASIILGDHVWICPNTKIMKGGGIGSGSIIGSDSTVSKQIPTNVLAVGRPARVVRENVRWTREKLF